ncbi:MAG: quinone-dependent dihydroorotate dehydrogenase [Beijerinckiaceae bacterium]|jgi:dihydroorotate dehydrogenase
MSRPFGMSNASLLKAGWALARPLLHRLDPERAHDLTLQALKYAPLPAPAPDDPSLKVEAFGLTFANPIGLAAGFDKNGAIAHKAHLLGFGFAEIGTLTPRPQAGNPKPRLFRLPEEQAVINRFGFNNLGHEHAARTLKKAACVLGINIGANKDASDRVADYVSGIHAFSGLADYFTINVSSPNTPNLRDLQKPEALDDLLARVLGARDSLTQKFGRTPVLLKIAPDLSLGELDGIVKVARAKKIDGMIVSNTTITRPGATAQDRAGLEAGGLSGKPLFPLATRMLAATYLRVDRQFPLVGVGGVDSAGTALAKIEAGATLVQLYSALVFHGPGLIATIKQGLAVRDLAAAVGSKAADWAKV